MDAQVTLSKTSSMSDIAAAVQDVKARAEQMREQNAVIAERVVSKLQSVSSLMRFMSDRIERMQDDVSDGMRAKSRASDMETQLSMARSNLDRARSEISELRLIAENSERELGRQRRDAEVLRRDLAAALANRDEMQFKIDDMNGQLVSLRSSLKESRDAKDNLMERISSLTAEISDKQVEIDRLTLEIEEFREAASMSFDSFESRARELEEKNLLIRSQAESVTRMKSDISVLKARLEDHKGLLAQKDEHIRTLELSENGLRMEMDALTTDMSRVRSECETLRKRLAILEAERDENLSSVDEMRAKLLEMNAVEARARSLEEALSETKAQVVALEDVIEEERSKIRQSNTQISELRQKVDARDSDIRSISAALKEKDAEIHALKQEGNLSLKAINEELQEERARLDRLQATLIERDAEILQLTENLSLAEERSSALSIKLDAMTARAEDAERGLNDASASASLLQELKTLLETKTVESDRLKVSFQKCFRTLSEQRKANDRLRSENDRLKAQIDALMTGNPDPRAVLEAE